MPALDGLRAISIVLVLLGHLRGTQGYPGSDWFAWLRVAELGVGVFFVISGFLITTLLLDEHERKATVSLKDFYVRRAYRILPASYSYVAVMAILSFTGVIALQRFDLVHAFTYTTNYNQDRAWWLGHLWSLSVEEQFYLLWPALILLLGPRRAMLAAASAIALAPLSRIALALLWPSHLSGMGEYFPTVCDGLATGCLLAGLRPWLGRHPRYVAFASGPLFWLVPLGALATLYLNTRFVVSVTIEPIVVNTSIALLIDHCLRCAGGPFVRVLDWRPVARFGTLSYSLYLWQQPFVNRTSKALVSRFPLSVILAVGAATLSYHAIEQPFLALRARRSARKRALAAA